MQDKTNADIDVYDLLGHLSAEELRELADRKQRLEPIEHMVRGMRAMADAIEKNPELLDWQKLGKASINAWNHGEDKAEADAWFDRIKTALGGEWEVRNIEGYRIERLTFGGPFGVELNWPLPDDPESDELAAARAQREAAADDPRGEADR
jgi:hypothetical protein